MPLAALIIVGDYGVGERPPLLMRIAGQTLLERMIRQLAAAGANHIVLLVTAVPADIVSVIDQLSREGLSIDLARGAADAADRIHPDETLLFIDGPLVLAQGWFERVRDQPGDTLVTVPKAAGERFERIDAQDHWLGLGRIEGGTLRAISAELGDWALGPTLLRKAIQQGATRLPFDGDATRLIAVRPETLEELAVAQSVLVEPHVQQTPGGWFAKAFDRAGGARIAQLLAKRNIAFQTLEFAGLALFLLSLLACFFGMTGWAVVALLFGAMTWQTAQIIRTIAIGGKSLARGIAYASDAALLALPVMSALQFGFVITIPALLAAWVLVQWLLMRQLRGIWPQALGWTNDNAGLALIFGLGWGINMLAAAMGVIIMLLIIEHALRQHFAHKI